MDITVKISPKQIADLMISFVESGDPVTRGWCSGVNIKRYPGTLWYAKPEFYANGRFRFEISEMDDFKEVIHVVRKGDMIKGFAVMAKKFPNLFAQIISDNADAPCADIAMQCICFGEEKYA